MNSPRPTFSMGFAKYSGTVERCPLSEVLLYWQTRTNQEETMDWNVQEGVKTTSSTNTENGLFPTDNTLSI